MWTESINNRKFLEEVHKIHVLPHLNLVCKKGKEERKTQDVLPRL